MAMFTLGARAPAQNGAVFRYWVPKILTPTSVPEYKVSTLYSGTVGWVFEKNGLFTLVPSVWTWPKTSDFGGKDTANPHAILPSWRWLLAFPAPNRIITIFATACVVYGDAACGNAREKDTYLSFDEGFIPFTSLSSFLFRIQTP